MQTQGKASSEQGDIYKKSRILYIAEAALEYFITLFITGAYLAKVTSYIGMSDALTGILSSFVSLGGCFQIVALFLANKRPVKRWVTALHSVNQLFFALIYFVPFFKASKTVKTALFILFLLAGYAINYAINSPKITWFMSLVDDDKRGAFTAKKETVSLVGGMIVSFVLGLVIESFEEAGDLRGSFLFCGIGIIILAALHTYTLLASREKPTEVLEKTSVKDTIKDVFGNKNLLKIIVVPALWFVITYATTPFYGTYQNKELGFSMTFVSVLVVVASLTRALASRPFGKYADKTSFRKMLNVCLWIELIGYAFAAFAAPSNGKVTYTLYLVLYYLGMAGINSSMINLVYDYVKCEQRMCAFAVSQTVSGLVGFLTTLAVSPFVSFMQRRGNTLFGVTVYAQQILSVFGCVMIVLLMAYLNTVVKKIQKTND